MLRQRKFSVRVQFLMIAVSMFIMTTILGLSAYLNKNVSSSISFNVMTESDMYIELIYNKETAFDVVPGEKVDLDLKVQNNSKFPVYLFARLSEKKGVIHKKYLGPWESFDYEGTNVYYYGQEDELKAVSGKDKYNNDGEIVDFIDYVTISDDVKGGQGTLYITVYAIQTAGHTESTPEAIWHDVEQG